LILQDSNANGVGPIAFSFPDGAGRVFYYRPGHETYPVYRQEIPLRIVENAARWLGSTLVD
jgi:trehalose utilization protein